MSVYKKKNSIDKSKKQEIIHIESPLIILKNQNTSLGEELNKINNLITKLKAQIAKNEQEKNTLITNNQKKEKDLQEIMKTLEDSKSQLKELELQEQNLKPEQNNQINTDNNNKKIEENCVDDDNITIELKKKITELELKLKLSEKKIFTSLMEGKGSWLEIKNNEKDRNQFVNNNINIKFNNNSKVKEINEAKHFFF